MTKLNNTITQAANVILDLSKECQLQDIVYRDELRKQANLIIATRGNDNYATNVDNKEDGQ